MGRIKKTFALILTLIIAISFLALLIVKHANAQSIPIPSVPEFTASLVGPSYVVNTTYSLDQDTGEIVPQLGYTNPYSFLNITIKNQPYSPFVNPANGLTLRLMYNVRLKPHNETDSWTEVFNPWNDGYVVQSNSYYTNISLSIQGQPDSPLGPITGIQADIQVEALIGVVTGHLALPTNGGFPSVSPVFNGTESGWSKTQTIDVPANILLTTTLNPPATYYPSDSFLLITIAISLIVISILLAVIIALLLLLRKRKTSNLSG